MAHKGRRDGHQVRGGVWRKVLLLDMRGGREEATQAWVVASFLQLLVEQAEWVTRGRLSKLTLFRESAALEMFAAQYLQTHGFPKREPPGPWDDRL